MIQAGTGKHGIEVIACDGRTSGCFDLTRAGLIAALKTLEAKAKGAELALVFFAGHGVQAAEATSLPRSMPASTVVSGP